LPQIVTAHSLWPDMAYLCWGRGGLVMMVAVAGGDVRIGWAKRAAAAAEAGPASVRSVGDYLVCSLSGCRSLAGGRSPMSKAGRCRGCDGLIR
jgi:hypothetical protein